MKKKIVAILATIAAVFGFGFAANTAMAVDYGPTGAGKVSGNTAVFTFKNLDNSKTYIVSSDDQNGNLTGIKLAKVIYSNPAQPTNGVLTATYTFKEGFAGTINSAIYEADGTNAVGNPVATASVTVAATGEGTAKKNETASTGAAIAPYVVAVVLLAAAGISPVAVRKSSAR